MHPTPIQMQHLAYMLLSTPCSLAVPAMTHICYIQTDSRCVDVLMIPWPRISMHPNDGVVVGLFAVQCSLDASDVRIAALAEALRKGVLTGM